VQQLDLRDVNALLLVFAMPGCGACDEYLPRFEKLVKVYRAQGAPFQPWQPGQQIARGTIPVLVYDAAADNTELQAFCDRLGITATPTTALMTRKNTAKIEGAIDNEQIERLLQAAMNANR
jgi:thiol-disulfide isomerase/thioredoxin